MTIFLNNGFLRYFYKLFILSNVFILIAFSCKNRHSSSGLLQSGDFDERALIQYTDSIAKSLKNNPVYALSLMDSVIKISEAQKYEGALMNALYESARYKNRLGNFSEAYRDLQRAYPLTSFEDSDLTTLIFIEMAESQRNMIHYPVADSLLQVAGALADKNKSAHHLAAIHSTAANVESGRGNFEEATALFLKAAPHYSEIQDSANLAIVYESIGLLYRQSGNYDQAFGYIRKAFSINQALADTSMLAVNKNNMGVLFLETNQLDSAIVFYQKSLNLYRRLNSKIGLAMTFMNIANLLIEKNDFDVAENYLDSSLTIIHQTGSAYGLLLEQINRAGLFMKKGEAKKAIPMLEDALEKCDKMELISEKAEVLKMIYEAWLAEGNHEKALFYFTNHHLIADSLRSANIQQKLAGAQNDFEIKNREVKLLKLENSLSAAAAKSRNQRHFLVTAVVFLMLIALILFYRKRSVEMQSALIKVKLEKALANLEIKNRELLNHAKQLSQMKEYTEKIVPENLINNDISETANEVKPNIKNLKNSIQPTNGMMKEIESRFEYANKAFFIKILQLHPNLSPSELRLCGFLRSNMTSKEIAVLTNRSLRTIENTRNRIRHKMILPPETNLVSYLAGIK